MTDDTISEATLDAIVYALQVRLASLGPPSPIRKERRTAAAAGLLCYHMAMIAKISQAGEQDLLSTAALLGVLWARRRHEIENLIPVFRETDTDLH